MTPNRIKRLLRFADEERIGQVMSVPGEHFYGITLEKEPEGWILRARYSPTGERPIMIKIDGGAKQFVCTCLDFQRRASYPARMGLFLCDHVLRTLTLIDPSRQDALDLDGTWTCKKSTPEFERQEVLQQTRYYFHQGDILAALDEVHFGIETAVLRDLDVNNLLVHIDPDSIEDEDLAAGVRFARAAIERGFTRKTNELAMAWIERFAKNADIYAPFLEVAPIALWLKQQWGRPGVRDEEIRSRVLKALDRAREEGNQGSSWWLLYRAVSRGTAEPPQTCVAAWLATIESLRLALVEPERINTAVQLLRDFGIRTVGADFEYRRKYESTLQSARESRMRYLLNLIRACRLDPFLEMQVCSYGSQISITMKAHHNDHPLVDLILTAIDHKGDLFSLEQLMENWPVIRQCLIEIPPLDTGLREKLDARWPNPSALETGPSSIMPVSRGLVVVKEESRVVRWEPAGPTLISGSPLVAHHNNRIYIPARGGAIWPEPFGLTLCEKPKALRHRFYSVPSTHRLDAQKAIELIRKGARWIGPRDDPVRLAALPFQSIPLNELLSVPGMAVERQRRLKRDFWFPDRIFLLEKMAFCVEEATAWIRRRLWSALAGHEAVDPYTDLGVLFGCRLNAVADAALWGEMENLAAACASEQEWLARLALLLTERLPRMDRPDEPINIHALPGTPLAPAILPLVHRRTEELGAIAGSLRGERVDLRPLKGTVYGRMILDELSLLDRDQVSGHEARELAENYSDLLHGLQE